MQYLEDKKLLELRFKNGMLILPFIRYELMCYINKNKVEFLASKAINKKTSTLKKIISLIKHFPKIAFKRKSIVYFSSTLFNLKKTDTGKCYNSLHGYYAELFSENSLIIEDSDVEMQWRTPYINHSVSYFHTYVQLFSSIIAHILCRFVRFKNADYDYLLQHYPELYTMKKIIYLDIFYKTYYILMRKILGLMKSKLVFINCGLYGATYACLSKVVNDLNLISAEIQHGAISTEHLAYHVDGFISESSEYQCYIPKYLLVFGKYWEQNVDWRVNKIIVGNPHLMKYVKNINVKNKVTFLLISQPVVHDIILNFAKALALVDIGKKVLVRLHPREKIEDIPEAYLKISNLEFTSSKENLYDDFARTNYVLGSFSTCLYEAIAFSKIPFIIDCKESRTNFDSNVGIWVTTATEVFESLNAADNLSLSKEVDDMWAKNFDLNVSEFITDVLKDRK